MAEGKKGFFGRLVEGLAKTRNNIVSGIDSIFSGFSAIDDDFYEEIEETLIMGDLGIETTMSIVENLRRQVKERGIKEPEECKELLIESIKAQMDLGENAYEFENRTSVVLVIGVNGVGKTTSVGKLAGQLKDSGRKVVLAAADTFRAAAIEQLTEWANRAGVDIIAQQEGSDPAAVIYDAVNAAKSRIPGGLPRDPGGSGRNNGAECPGPGAPVHGSSPGNRHYPDKAGRHGQGGNRRSHPVRAGNPGKIHRYRREDRRSPEVQRG